jgi:membrane protein
MAVMLAFLKVPLSWGQIFRRTFSESVKDDCLGMAAQLAYYFFFALFPTLLVMLALAKFFAADLVQLLSGLGGFVPPRALELVIGQITSLSEGEQGGLLTIGMLTAVWSSSAAMTAIISTLNTAYDIEEGRPWWKVRATAIALTVGLSLFIIVALGLVIAGPTLAERLADRLFLGTAFEWTWKILQWPIVFMLVSAGIGLVYYFAPDAEQDWVWLTPGSIFATTMWLIVSLGFKYYVATMGAYESYGVIGGVMVLMLWFYLSGLVMLVGAEMNAEIEHASEYGKDVGEKVPGEKRKIGPALKRDWEARHRGGKRPDAADVRKAVGGTLTPTAGAPQPAPVMTFSANQASWLDAVLAVPIVIAQAVFTFRFWNRTRS